MHLISAENMAKNFGDKLLFDEVSFSIHQGDKTAFIAKNGSGKTTILKILMNKETPDKGQVVKRKNLTIGFLEQEPQLDEQLSIEQVILSSNILQLKIINDYEKSINNEGDLENLQKNLDLMDQHQCWDFEQQYQEILYKLQLPELDKTVKYLSGGQKKRLALAVLLLQKPDVMILDEPTNHLDLEMIEWLEAYFAKEPITLFMVTHDRYFLERVCNKIIELDFGKIYTYEGNYAYFLTKKEERKIQHETELHKAKNLYIKELDWMRRQPKARTTKSKSRIDDFQHIKEKAFARKIEHVVELEMVPHRMGSKIVEFHKVTKHFKDLCILNQFDYNFKKNEKIGVIGKNGTGKSTFLNLLTKTDQPDAGKVVHGDTIKMGYYTQKGIVVKPNQKVIEVIKEFGEYIPLAKGRILSASQLLEKFLFDNKKQYDFVEKLSGGELKRLYLCTVLIQNPNFLILDEPTNDLDIVTLNILENYLLDFPGCVVVVSHDRYFMDKIVDHLLVFNGQGDIVDFPGNYSDYRAYESSQEPTEKSEKSEKSDKSVNVYVPTNSASALTFDEQKLLKKLEKDMAQLEQQKQKIEAEFANQAFSEEEINKKSLDLQNIIQELQAKEDTWFELSSKSESSL